ncbi:MAG TPA: hypothetical protein VF221_00295 [Chloroflexota bacterium]
MGKTIVVLEDDADLGRLVAELLEEQEYNVVVVSSIEDLLVDATRRSPCVTLVDGTSSTEFDLWWLGPVLRKLGANPVVFTAHASAREEFERDAHGYIGVVSKPFDADELVEIVSDICWEESKAAV